MMRSALTSLAIAATLAKHVHAEFVIEDDVYFYGQSEPVYPTRECHIQATRSFQFCSN